MRRSTSTRTPSRPSTCSWEARSASSPPSGPGTRRASRFALCPPACMRAGGAGTNMFVPACLLPPLSFNSCACLHTSADPSLHTQSIDWRTQPPPRRIPGNTKHDQGKLFELPKTWSETTDSCWDQTQVQPVSICKELASYTACRRVATVHAVLCFPCATSDAAAFCLLYMIHLTSPLPPRPFHHTITMTALPKKNLSPTTPCNACRNHQQYSHTGGTLCGT